jgi:hypothetical protein
VSRHRRDAQSLGPRARPPARAAVQQPPSPQASSRSPTAATAAARSQSRLVLRPGRVEADARRISGRTPAVPTAAWSRASAPRTMRDCAAA